MSEHVDTKAAQPVRRRRSWWQWLLGGGLLSVALILLGVRVAMRLWPQAFVLDFLADPIPLRVPEGMRETDRVSLSPGALAGCNVLLVTLDTTRADRLGCYGNKGINTPALDGLARGGVLFTKTISPAPTTLPAHSSILSGLYLHHHGALANAVFRLEDKITTLPEVLSEKGYATGAAISAIVLDSRFGVAQGFDEYDDALENEWTSRPRGEKERTANVTTDIALEWLRRNRGKPFFYWIHYFDPHQPYEPPGQFADDYAHFPYDGEIAFTDSQLARLLDYLEESGVRENTLVVVIGDHGQGMGQHQEITHGFMLYDATLHVPFIMNCPSKLPGGAYVSREVSSVDVLPTVLSLLGVERPDECDGIDLTQPPPQDRLIYMATTEALHQFAFAPLLGVRDGKHKYIFGPQPELYDIVSDPHEGRDLIAEAKDVADTLRARLEAEHGGDLVAAGYTRPSEQLSEDDVKMFQQLGYVVSGVSVAPPQGDLPNPRDMMPLVYQAEEAYTHEGKEDAAEAAARLQKIVEEHPDFYVAFRWLADCYIEIDDYANARIALERCEELQPGVPYPLSNLARIYYFEGKRERAIKLYEQVLLNCPDHFPALAELGAIYLNHNQPIKAAELLLRACTVRPTDELSVDRMAEAMKRADRVDEAIVFLRHRLSKNTRLRAVRNALAGLLLERGKCGECIALMRETLELNPESMELVNNLSWALVRCSHPRDPALIEAVLKMEEVCSRLEYKEPYYLRTLAAAYFAQRRVDEALTMTERAIKLATEANNQRLKSDIETDMNLYRRAKALGVAPTTVGIPGAPTTSGPSEDSPDSGEDLTGGS